MIAAMATPSLVHPGEVDWSGENPGMYLKEKPDGSFVTLVSFFRVVASPFGRGHALVLLEAPRLHRSLPEALNVCVTDNDPLARYLVSNFVTYFGVQGRRGPAVHGLRPARRRGRLRRSARQLHGVGQGTRGGGVAVLGRSRRALHGEHPQGAVGHGQARASQPLRGRAPRDHHRERPSPQGPAGAARVRRTAEQHRLPRLLGDVDQDVAARSLIETRQWTRSSSGG